MLFMPVELLSNVSQPLEVSFSGMDIFSLKIIDSKYKQSGSGGHLSVFVLGH